MNEAPAGLRDQLLDHAIAMLEAGEAEPGIRALARAAGVSAMAPYRHFADKQALLAAVAGRGFVLLGLALEAADARGDDATRLIEQGLAYVAFATAHPALFRLMFARDCGAADVGGATFDILARRVSAIAGDDAAHVTLGCWAIVHGLATLALDGRIPADQAQARAVLSAWVAGVSRPT